MTSTPDDGAVVSPAGALADAPTLTSRTPRLGRVVSMLWELAPSVVAALAALMLAGAAIAASGRSPLRAYGALWSGAFGSEAALGRTLVAMTPLVFTGLAAAFSFKAGLFNVGAEGQLYLGALTAAYLGTMLPFDGAPAIAVIVLAGSVAGALWGGVAGCLKAIRGASEIVTTLMLNFIAISFTGWAVLHLLSSGEGFPSTASISQADRLPVLSVNLGAAHWGLAIALGLAVAVSLILRRTSWGYELRVTGAAPECARYAGMPVARNMALALTLSGAMAGLGGAIEILGVYGNLVVPWVVGLGFTGIAVALIGRLHPFGCVLGALLIGALSPGGQQMEFEADVPRDLVQLLMGMLLLFVTVSRIPPEVKTLLASTKGWQRLARLRGRSQEAAA